MEYIDLAPLTVLVYLRILIFGILKNTDIEILTSIKQVLTKEKLNLVIVPHENPDGDAIGSALGLAEILADFGHRLTIISPNDYPDFLKWFAAKTEIIIYGSSKKKAKSALNNADVLICVDFNDASRAGNLEKKLTKFSKPRILIDHHPYPSDFCEYTVSEITYSSTAELIYDVIQQIGLGGNITHNAAEALYTGILTDTGAFNHNTSRPNTFKVVSELMKFGIDTEKIQSGVYHNFSENRMKLLGYCLNEKMQVFPEYRTAVISITKEELERFDFKPGDTEGFVNYPLSIKNIVFSVLFIEKEELVKMSFRSKGNFATNKMAREYFNGGGHLNASGGESKLTLKETLNKFTQLLPEFKHQLIETII